MILWYQGLDNSLLVLVVVTVVSDQGFNGDRASQVALVVKNTAASAGEGTLIPGLGWSFEEGHGNLLQ